MRQNIKLFQFTSFMKFLSLFLLMTCTALSVELNEEQIKNIKETKLVLTTEKIKDKVWPKVIVKAYLEAPALESAAIFAEFDHQPAYIPNMKSSKVVKEEVTEQSNDIHIQYIMDMPWPISDSEYINGHNFSQNKEDFSYKVSWYQVKNDNAKSVNGHAIFTPFPGVQGATLMQYEAHVDPSSFMAGALRKFMVRDVKASVEAVQNEVKKLKKTNPESIKKFVDKFQAVLSGKPAYLLKS